MKSRKILFILILFISQLAISQEICDNAIDDDNDGLIDFNDEDCFCNSLVPSSLIPNPSFEERTCCPMGNARLDCAVGWIQASNPTTDYVHTCGGYLGNTSIPAFASLPFPDGEGGVGFRDGQKNAGVYYKEYVGACLTEKMKPNTEYRLDFFVGFQNNVIGSRDFKIAVFASAKCADLPFGGNNNNIGCPLNANGYVQLGELEIKGNNEWVNVVFEFVASASYEVIILGPSCSPNPNYIYDPYFFLDRLALAESTEFGIPFESIEGSICQNDLTLSVENQLNNQYQWYKDGIALIGEQDYQLILQNEANVEGTYMVVVIDEFGCAESKKYVLTVPPYYNNVVYEMCENELFIIAQDTFYTTGNYEVLLEAKDGCDSIVVLDLNVIPNTFFEFDDFICDTDIYEYLDISASIPGMYTTTIRNQEGCDSVIVLNLNYFPTNKDVNIPDTLIIDLGDEINVVPQITGEEYSEYLWYNDYEAISLDKALRNYKAAISAYIFLDSEDNNGCVTTDSVFIKIKPYSYQLVLPNIFSPDDNGINDYFNFYADGALQKVNIFLVFDRWGNLVYKAENVLNFEVFVGWDGKFNGKKALPGVYTYLIEADFIDGYKSKFAGDITIIR